MLSKSGILGRSFCQCSAQRRNPEVRGLIRNLLGSIEKTQTGSSFLKKKMTKETTEKDVNLSVMVYAPHQLRERNLNSTHVAIKY